MEKVNFVCSSSIIFCGKKTITETNTKLDKYYVDCTIDINGKKWCTQFRRCRTSTIDAERSGRPVEVTLPETIETSKEV